MPLVDHPTGNYRFLPGIAPYSCGVVSAPNFEIVHVVLQRPIPYVAGFDAISQHLASEGRPRAALCAVELRSPRPFTFRGFADFNGAYAAILKEWGLFVDGVNPVARTNVAPAAVAIAEPVLYGFSYSKPLAASIWEVASPSFVVAGAGELPEGVLEDSGIVAAGDTSPGGMATKAAFVLDLMEARLKGLGADWDRVSAVDIYTIHPLDALLPHLNRRLGPAVMHGLHCHHTRPPIERIEFEMDLRGVRTELRIDAVSIP